MKKLMIIAMSLILLISCSKEKVATTKIDGDWVVESTNVPEFRTNTITSDIVLGEYNIDTERGSVMYYEGTKQVKTYYYFNSKFTTIDIFLPGGNTWYITKMTKKYLGFELKNGNYYHLKRKN